MSHWSYNINVAVELNFCIKIHPNVNEKVFNFDFLRVQTRAQIYKKKKSYSTATRFLFPKRFSYKIFNPIKNAQRDYEFIMNLILHWSKKKTSKSNYTFDKDQ